MSEYPEEDTWAAWAWLIGGVLAMWVIGSGLAELVHEAQRIDLVVVERQTNDEQWSGR